jgi:hypothetical protein
MVELEVAGAAAVVKQGHSITAVIRRIFKTAAALTRPASRTPKRTLIHVGRMS